MKVVFFGYGELGAVVLGALVRHHMVGLVVTHQPGFTGLDEPDTLDLATRNGLTVHLSSHAREARVAELVRAADADIVVSTNWRTRLPAELLSITPLGALNVHDALLPSYSGFGAVNWAIRNGEVETGVTVHLMEPELDTGPVVARAIVPIGPHDTAAEIYRAVTDQYVPTTLDALERQAAGKPTTTQDGRHRRFYHRIQREDVRIDWTLSTGRIYDLIRAQSDPYLNAWTTYRGEPVAVKAAALPVGGYCGTPGRIVRRTERGVAVVCGRLGAADSRGIILTTVQPADGDAVPAGEFFPSMTGYLV